MVAGHSDCSFTLLLSWAHAVSLTVSAAGARSSKTGHYSVHCNNLKTFTFEFNLAMTHNFIDLCGIINKISRNDSVTGHNSPMQALL